MSSESAAGFFNGGLLLGGFCNNTKTTTKQWPKSTSRQINIIGDDEQPDAEEEAEEGDGEEAEPGDGEEAAASTRGQKVAKAKGQKVAKAKAKSKHVARPTDEKGRLGVCYMNWCNTAPVAVELAQKKPSCDVCFDDLATMRRDVKRMGRRRAKS